MKKKSSKKQKTDEEESKQPTKLKTCTHVKARHVLCEKLSKIQQAFDLLNSEHGKRPPIAAFSKVATEYSECSSAKKGGDLGWFARGKMVGPFQDVAFKTPEGEMSEIFKTVHGYHFLLVEGRKN